MSGCGSGWNGGEFDSLESDPSPDQAIEPALEQFRIHLDLSSAETIGIFASVHREAIMKTVDSFLKDLGDRANKPLTWTPEQQVVEDAKADIERLRVELVRMDTLARERGEALQAEKDAHAKTREDRKSWQESSMKAQEERYQMLLRAEAAEARAAAAEKIIERLSLDSTS